MHQSTPTISIRTDEAIQQLFDRQVRAWNAGDADLYAQTFAENVTATNILGDNYVGRQALASRMAEILGSIFKGSTLELGVRRIAFVRADVAVVDLEARVTGFQRLPPGVTAPDGVLRTAMLQLVAKEEDAWRAAAFHNVAIAATGSARTSERTGR